MSSTDYSCVYAGGRGEIVEKKSRFIATVRPIASEEEALSFIEEMKKTYWDATHNCSAFALGLDPQLERCSDDGEPQGTAGRPMLEALLHAGIHDTAVVVTRYFGGTLLGTGGLVRAYTEAVKKGLEESTVIEKKYGRRLLIETDYNGIGKLQYTAAGLEIPLLTTDYSASVTCTVFVTEATKDAFCKKILEQTCGKAKITPLENTYFASVNGKNLLFDR